MFAQVVFPLPFRNSFTYSVPEVLTASVKMGVRVVVPFGKRILTGFVIGISEETDIEEKIKPIRDVLDEKPIFDSLSLQFYEWIAEYYLSSLGEALRNSVPYGTDIESKRKIVADQEYCKELLSKEKKKTSVKAKLLAQLLQKETHRISTLQKQVKRKNIYSSLRALEKAGCLTILNEIDDAKVRIKKLKFVQLAKQIDELYEVIPIIEKKSSKQVVVLLELLSQKGNSVQLSELLKKTNSHYSSIHSLEKKGIVKVFEKEVERFYVETYEEKLPEFELTEKQTEVVTTIAPDINNSRFQTFLLHGVTGSGKTQIYIELTKIALAKKKSVIILVPEISLTPQITSRFYNYFKDKVAVIHSRLSLGERYDTWRGIIAGKFKIVIGARSALFAPLSNLGLIVVDEEHDHSYKQFEYIPKYHARDAAVIYAKLSNCPIVLGSATPSVESMYNASTNKYKLIDLKERVDNAKLPRINLIDITIEKKRKRMENVFSRELIEKIADRIKKKEGVIILQNRRGFATQVFCEDCGEIVMCSDCSVPMVHHINRNLMQCHYCGISRSIPKACNICGSLALKFFGTGTQRVEDELDYYFPEIKIERVDSDSMSRKGKFSAILNSFRKGEIDVLVGTQMVSKGLDFSNVTLVGVISAETSLWMPDFRADERTFQLLTQVAGRSGRSKIEGEVLIQTQNQKHFILQKVVLNDYDGFYTKEIELRKQNGYPPFTRLCLIEFKDEDEKRVRFAASDFFNILRKQKSDLIITPPSEAIIFKIKGNYRYHIMIKSFRSKDLAGKLLRKVVFNSSIEYNQKSRFRDVRFLIDMDPQSIV